MNTTKKFKIYDGEFYYVYDGSDITRGVGNNPTMEDFEDFTSDWDYNGIAQRLDIFAVRDGEDMKKLGYVVVDGRYYQCPKCHSRFPHPPQELAVCECGYVGTEEDLEPESELVEN